MALIKRLDIGRPITAAEMDANLQYLEDSISAGTSGVSGTSGTSGVSGSPGVSGSSGSSGTRGTSGSSGISGSSGTSGISGSSGTSGAGTNGTSGISGSSGTSGVGSAGSSGTSGTSLALSIFDGDLTRLTGIQKLTLSGLGLNPSGSDGATITNFGGGGGGSTINVQSGSTTVSSVSTVRVDASTMSLTNNGGGTVTIGVTGGGVAGSSGTSGTSGSGGTSVSLTLRKDAFIISSIRDITLSGSIFLDVSGSGGAILRVEGGSVPVTLSGVVSSSQQIENYNVFAETGSSNIFYGTQTISGSLNASAAISSVSLFVQNAIDMYVPQGNIIVGGTGNRSAFLSTSSLTAIAAINVVDSLNVPFSNTSTIKFSNDFAVQNSGSGVVLVSSLAGGGGVGFPFTGSAVITGSLTVTGSITTTQPITASAFSITSVGVPTIESATNLNLTAGGTVVVSSSPIRLATFTNAQTGSITAVNGDMIYNSTTHKFMGYASGSWVQLH
jgi:hypothetical protein